IIITGIVQTCVGFGKVLNEGMSKHKLISADNWKMYPAAADIPIIFLGSIFSNLRQYTASQDVVQRYQASESVKETSHSMWTNGVLAPISAPLFSGMGTV
ncbi:Na+/proline symporter, partial [Staphylococcus pseudintermedius]